MSGFVNLFAAPRREYGLEVETFAEMVERLASRLEDLARGREWLEDYVVALKSATPVVVLHFNVDDFFPLIVHKAWSILGRPAVVYLDRHSSSVYPPSAADLLFDGYSSLSEVVRDAVERGDLLLVVRDLASFVTKHSDGGVSLAQPISNIVRTALSYENGSVVVICAHYVEEAPPTLLESARVIEVPLPDLEQRRRIIEELKRELAAEGVELAVRESRAAFFLGGLSIKEIRRLVRNAAARAEVRRGRKVVTEKDVALEKTKIRSAANKYLSFIKGDFPWRFYAGMPKVKEVLERDVITPLEHIEEAQSIGSRPPAGILLMGPPGTGKTTLVKALASRLPYVPFFRLVIESILSMWVGESNKNLAKALRHAANSAPCILFIDEIDTMFPQRESLAGPGQGGVMVQLLGQFLQFMEEEARKRMVIVIAATNKPSKLDEALISRFPVRIPVLSPKTEREREEILLAQLELRGVRIDGELAEAVREVARLTQGFTPREFRNLVEIACNRALRRHVKSGAQGRPRLEPEDLLEAVKEIQPQPPNVLEREEKLALTYATVK